MVMKIFHAKRDWMAGWKNEDCIEDIAVCVGSDDEEGTVGVRQKKVQVDPKDQEGFDRALKAIQAWSHVI
uniref:Uncharacterized protein n=1 Tax=Zea mays TaxID=4577 RepID=B6TDS6_MAIZE|nr:hypothetical protein [Zea mays]